MYPDWDLNNLVEKLAGVEVENEPLMLKTGPRSHDGWGTRPEVIQYRTLDGSYLVRVGQTIVYVSLKKEETQECLSFMC